MSAWGDHEEGWDLFAVVRSCRAASWPLAQPPEAAEKVENSGSHRQEFSLTRSEAFLPSNFTDLMAAGNYHLELQKFCLPFYTMDREPKETLFPCSLSLPSPAAAVPSTTRLRPQPRSTARSKRRRNQQKRVVCHVPADGLAADKWAWRKYGQKPIKGSPYPRGYYRCSSSKGCSARKQVERSKSDPEKFVITYTAEHNHPLPTHRNSLAGSTRQKFPSKAVTAGEQGSLSENSPSTTTTEEDLLRRVKRGKWGAPRKKMPEKMRMRRKKRRRRRRRRRRGFVACGGHGSSRRGRGLLHGRRQQPPDITGCYHRRRLLLLRRRRQPSLPTMKLSMVDQH
ncbi:hypothetical protein HPP92_023930 [Vanilla planifolia]|uniref:WRKY domain-containing protein n=1 Tax=Vanilla planifolia TaxID=51239 RepID=A0A835PNR4_VANPL|nr:hypothetical protein HPP92_023930 [Vanilla planifolia]